MSPRLLWVLALGALLPLPRAWAAEPDEGDAALEQAMAYQDQGNGIWAIRTLLARVEAAPDDAEARAWAAWTMMQDGDLRGARRLLEAAPEHAPGPDDARLDLLEAALLQLEGSTEQAEPLLAELRQAPALWDEDRAMLAELRQEVLGDRGEPVSARVQLEGGWGSNVIESAPQDAGSGRAGARTPQAPLAAVDAVLRYEPWTSAAARPLVELRGKGSSPFTPDTLGFAYLSAGARAGLELGPASGTRARLLYGNELMGLRGDPDPSLLDEQTTPVTGGWIMEAHRGDLELDLSPRVQLFGGAGRRIYSELPRTRTELDGGGALVLDLAPGWNLTALGTARKHWARHPGWDAWGLTGLLRLRAPLPGDAMFKARAMLLWDRWPQLGLWEPSEPYRQDKALRLEAGPWTPDLRGWRLGLTYNLATRESNLDAYDYIDHRVLFEARWQHGWDPGRPAAAPHDGHHHPLAWGLEEQGDLGLDRVQDLLRQEDSARRGSSCAD